MKIATVSAPALSISESNAACARFRAALAERGAARFVLVRNKDAPNCDATGLFAQRAEAEALDAAIQICVKAVVAHIESAETASHIPYYVIDLSVQPSVRAGVERPVYAVEAVYALGLVDRNALDTFKCGTIVYPQSAREICESLGAAIQKHIFANRMAGRGVVSGEPGQSRVTTTRRFWLFPDTLAADTEKEAGVLAAHLDALCTAERTDMVWFGVEKYGRGFEWQFSVVGGEHGVCLEDLRD